MAAPLVVVLPIAMATAATLWLIRRNKRRTPRSPDTTEAVPNQSGGESGAPPRPCLTPKLVHELAARYPVSYDDQLYGPYIEKGRKGDPTAICHLTVWKNGGPLSADKQTTLRRFIDNLPRYLPSGGSDELRRDYSSSCPVWAPFWSHILYGTPIIDRNTHAAYRFCTEGVVLRRAEAAIQALKHWCHLNEYERWFKNELAGLHEEDSTIDERMLDRALFVKGRELLGVKKAPLNPSDSTIEDWLHKSCSWCGESIAPQEAKAMKFKIERIGPNPSGIAIISYDKSLRRHFPPPKMPFTLEVDGQEYDTHVFDLQSGYVSIGKTSTGGERITKEEFCRRHGMETGQVVFIEVITPKESYRLTRGPRIQQPVPEVGR